MRTAAPTWPTACTPTGAVTGWAAVSRHAACAHEQFRITILQQPSGKVIGTTTMHAVNTMTASTTAARWSATSFLAVRSYTGVGLPSFTTARLVGSCPGCVSSGATWAKQTDGKSWRGAGNVAVTGLTVGKVRKDVSGFWQITLGGAGWGNTVVITLNLALSRCDNAFAGSRRPAGCVFSNIPGTVGYSQKALPDFVQHVYGAQLSGLPGRLGTTSYLTRLTNVTLKNRNGVKACPASLTVPKGAQCDEYPFRSTKEGAYTSKATAARSLPWCRTTDPERKGAKGWSRCFISVRQNLSATGTLSAFYLDERMLDGDRFQVGYLP
jgi:hypothetical protein